MNNPIQISVLKDRAKSMMAGKYFTAIMTIILFQMLRLFLTNISTELALQITATLQRLMGSAASQSFLLAVSYSLILLASVFYNIFGIGMCLFFLNIVSDNYYNSFDLFYGFRNHLSKSFALSGINTLITTFSFLPGDVLLYWYRSQADIPMNQILTVLSIQVVLLILYIPVSLMFSQLYYVALDYPELSTSETIKLSLKIMKGRKLRLFYLQASFLPLFLLLIPTFGLGALWLTPYLNTTYALYFLEIMKEDAK